MGRRDGSSIITSIINALNDADRFFVSYVNFKTKIHKN